MDKKVLIADDEEGIRDLFRFLLEPEGFEVYTARNGIEAVEVVKNNYLDIVFLDVHMPGMRGPEALSIIKKIKPEQTVVIFSSSSDPNFVFESEAKEHGAFDCMYKPFNIDDLLEIIERASGGINRD
jgi:DNA-binding NtrC family response regulator